MVMTVVRGLWEIRQYQLVHVVPLVGLSTAIKGEISPNLVKLAGPVSLFLHPCEQLSPGAFSGQHDCDWFRAFRQKQKDWGSISQASSHRSVSE